MLLLIFGFWLRKIRFYSIVIYISHPYHCFFSLLCSWSLTPLLSLSCKIEKFFNKFQEKPPNPTSVLTVEHLLLYSVNHIVCTWHNCLYLTLMHTTFTLFQSLKYLPPFCPCCSRLCWFHWCVIWPVFFTNLYITATFFFSAPCLHLQFTSNKGLTSSCSLLMWGACQGIRNKSSCYNYCLLQFGLLCCLPLFLIVMAIAQQQY